MANQLLVDVENVFKWQRTEDERIPSQGRIDYIQDQVRAVIWWSDQHMPPPAGVSPGWIDAVRGYGKLDPSGEAFTQVLLTWSPWLEPEANYLEHDEQAGRFTGKLDRSRSFPRNGIIVQAITNPGVSGSFRLVKFGRNVAETVLLEDADAVLAKAPSTTRLVLCSRDHLVVDFWNQHTAEDDTLLLTFKDPKSKLHQGDARVATLGVLAGVFKTLNRTGRILAPGTEITQVIFDRLRELAKSTRPKRNRVDREGSHRRADTKSTPRPAAAPVDLLRRVSWDDLTAGPPSTKSWSRAWGNEDLHLAVAAVMAEELKRIQATNDELGQCIEGLWDGATDDAVVAYRAFALIALHRLTEDGGESLGVAIRSNPELTAQFWRPYVLIQPYLGVPEGTDTDTDTDQAPHLVKTPRRTKRAGNRIRVHEAATMLGIDSKTALALLGEAGEVVRSPATILNRPQFRKLEALAEANLSSETDSA